MGREHIVGSILGTALGDSIGLPYEGLSKRRSGTLFGPPDRHRFLFRRGMISDDTEHTVMVVQSLISSRAPDLFRRSLAWKFRIWLALVPAGIGLATLKSILRLWCGVSPDRSGVFSAGNGPAMRAAVIGAALDDPEEIRRLVQVSSRITHTDPKAEFGAFAVAMAANMARQQSEVSGEAFVHNLQHLLGEDGKEMVALISDVVSSIESRQSTEAFAESMGLGRGVTGYVYHTVPVVIHAWLTHQHDFKSAITTMVRCGGDADSTAAILGGIMGAKLGEEGLPDDWLNGLLEWPCSVSFMKRVGLQLADSLEAKQSKKASKLPVWGLLPRNCFFLTVVLFHGFRRLLPPY